MSSKGANIQLGEKNARKDSLLFSEGGSRIIFSLNKKEELNFLHFVKSKIKDFETGIYVKKIGSVARDNLNISIEDNQICNLRVDQLTKKFNNSISSFFN